MQKSFFERAIFLKWLRRYWAGGALMCIAFSLAAVVLGVGLSQAADRSVAIAPARAAVFISESVLSNMFGVFCAAAGLVASLLCFQYLQNASAAVMVHSLPVTRAGVFVSVVAAGLVLLVVPILLCGVLFGIVMAMFGWFALQPILVFVLAMVAIALLWFAMATFFGMLSGNSVAQGMLCGLFVILPVATEGMLQFLLGRFLFGYEHTGGIITSYINPVTQMFEYLSRTAGAFSSGSKVSVVAPVVMLVVAAVVLVLAFLLYRIRNLEAAGDVIAMRGMRPVFRFGVALLGAMGFAMLFGDIMGSAGTGVVVYLLFGIVGGALGYFIAEMFIRKTVWVFRSFKGAVVFCALYAVFILVLNFDVAGYGSYQLQADKVQAIAIGSYDNRVHAAMTGGSLHIYDVVEDLDLDDPDGYVDKVMRGSVDEMPAYIAQQILEKDATVLWGDEMQDAIEFQNLIAQHAGQLRDSTNESYYYEEGVQYFYVPVTALMQDGSVVQRSYRFAVRQDEYEELIQLWEKVELRNRRGHIENTVNLLDKVNRITLHYNYYGMIPQERNMFTLNPGEWDGLIEAYRQDILQRSAEDTVYYDVPYITMELEVTGYKYEALDFDFGYENTVAWMVEKGYLSEEEAIAGQVLLREYLQETNAL